MIKPTVVGTLIAFVTISQLAVGASLTPEVPVMNGTVNSATWAALPTNANLQSCMSSQCVTLKILLNSFELLDTRDFPNSMARSEPPRSATVSVPIVNHAQTSEEAAGDACRFLATIVSNIPDLPVVLHGIELATLVAPIHAGCAHKVVDRAPKSLEGTSVLQEAHAFCLSRHEPVCNQISD